MLIRLHPRPVVKTWGRLDLPDPFGSACSGQGPIGEIVFEHPDLEADLLIKYLFTAEPSSIQVHPDDRTARAAGHERGKDEAWITLGAESNAAIGMGLRQPVDREALRAAALDGSIAGMIDWNPATPGDIYYSPAGTIHALGPGLTLLEVQQNADLTYRLHDYGRARPLHPNEGVEAANLGAVVARERPGPRRNGRETLSARGAFVLERWSGITSGRLNPLDRRPVWLIPIMGNASLDGETLVPGSVWVTDDPCTVSQAAGGQLIVAYSGESDRPGLLA